MKVVVSQRNTGLGDCLISLVSAWRYARDVGRKLIIDWRNSCYCDRAEQNAFDLFFESMTELAGVPVEIASTSLPISCWPPVAAYAYSNERERQQVLSRTEEFRLETVAMIKSGQDSKWPSLHFRGCLPVLPAPEQCRIMLEALRPKKEICEAVNAFREQYFGGHQVIGVHLRHGNGGDIMAHAKYWQSCHSPLERCVETLREIRDRLGKGTVIFACTDSSKVLQVISEQVERVISRDKFFLPEGSGELHLCAQGIAQDALIEMMLLRHVDILVRHPPDSYFSWWASLYSPECVSPLLLRPDGPDPVSP